MDVEGYRGEPTKGSAVGCMAVLLPLLSFGFVAPDAEHVWSNQAALDPLLWVVGSLLLWLGVKLLLDRAAPRLSPLAWWASIVVILAVSGAISVAIVGSI